MSKLFDSFGGAGHHLRPRKDNNVCTAHRGKRVAKKPSRKQRFASHRSRGIQQENVQIPGELEVLKAVVEKKNVHRPLGFEPLALGKAVLPYAEGNAILQTKFHQLDFVAAALGPAIAAAENGHALSLHKKSFGEPDHHGRLASAADAHGDRKSTRLNSSHSQISYAVFCLT